MEQRSGILEGYSCCLLSKEPGFQDQKVKGAQVLPLLPHVRADSSRYFTGSSLPRKGHRELLLHNLVSYWPLLKRFCTEGCIAPQKV